MQEVYLNFLHRTLPKFIQLNLLLQRSDPIIHLMYDALFDTLVNLLSRFMSPMIVTQYKNSEISDDQVGFLAKTQLKKLLEDGDITKRQYFLMLVSSFIKLAIYMPWETFQWKIIYLNMQEFLIFLIKSAHFRVSNFSLKN